MKRSVLCILVLTLVFAASATLASAQTPPVFQLGFKALADQLPASVVGVPTENEHFNLSNGNSEQHTTNGLMVWRKADNWTAYTNGYMTWVNGPNGVQSRLNTERFSWEAGGGTAAPQPAPAPAPTSSPVRPPASGVILFGSDYTIVDGGVAVVGVKSSFSRGEEMAYGFYLARPVGALSMDAVVAKVFPTGGDLVVLRSQISVATPTSREVGTRKSNLPSLLEPGQYKLRYFVINQLVAEGGFEIR